MPCSTWKMTIRWGCTSGLPLSRKVTTFHINVVVLRETTLNRLKNSSITTSRMEMWPLSILTASKITYMRVECFSASKKCSKTDLWPAWVKRQTALQSKLTYLVKTTNFLALGWKSLKSLKKAARSSCILFQKILNSLGVNQTISLWLWLKYSLTKAFMILDVTFKLKTTITVSRSICTLRK